MAKYRVHLGAFVTKLVERQFIESAPDEETAIQKAKDRFTSCYQEDAVYAECGSIEVDSVEEV